MVNGTTGQCLIYNLKGLEIDISAPVV